MERVAKKWLKKYGGFWSTPAEVRKYRRDQRYFNGQVNPYKKRWSKYRTGAINKTYY